MDFVSDPQTAKIRVQLTELGVKLVTESLLRLEQLSRGDAVRREGPVSAVSADSQGYYEMHLWLFMRAFGGYSLMSPLWLQQYVCGDIYFIITPQLAAAVTYPG